MRKKDICILGLETSCDETAASVVVNGRKVLSNIISSQIDIHKEYGGVVPEIASRAHVESVVYVADEALKTANVAKEDIDAVAVTYGPGLVGGLLVGISFAKGMSWAEGKPLIGVNHIEGHIAANYITHPRLKPPYICLVVSGGHSHIVNVKDYREFEILGRTRDDAAGEAFDKVSRCLGLGYPGGVAVQNVSLRGDPESIKFPRVKFPGGSFDFSFSGLKTSVINYLHNAKQSNREVIIPDVAASFQQAVIDVLTDNTVSAAAEADAGIITAAGGVAANELLRDTMKKKAAAAGIEVYYPDILLCTDNAAMIAAAGYLYYIYGQFSGLEIDAAPNLSL